MNDMIAWIAAEAEGRRCGRIAGAGEEGARRSAVRAVAHQFPARGA